MATKYRYTLVFIEDDKYQMMNHELVGMPRYWNDYGHGFFRDVSNKLVLKTAPAEAQPENPYLTVVEEV